mmetsp:Transcript_11841/g.35188  ORF Transcript_11841/g.35188 Transcript_11841/m.35188 type:complete len:247 (-) Transcript_11841:419-1159(-)
MGVKTLRARSSESAPKCGTSALARSAIGTACGRSACASAAFSPEIAFRSRATIRLNKPAASAASAMRTRANTESSAACRLCPARVGSWFLLSEYIARYALNISGRTRPDKVCKQARLESFKASDNGDRGSRATSHAPARAAQTWSRSSGSCCNTVTSCLASLPPSASSAAPRSRGSSKKPGSSAQTCSSSVKYRLPTASWEAAAAWVARDFKALASGKNVDAKKTTEVLRTLERSTSNSQDRDNCS